MLKRRLTIAATLLALLAVPFAANAANAANTARGPRSPADILSNPRALAKYLKLTPSQIDTTKALLEDLHNTTRPLYQQIEPLEKQLKTQLAAASPDACAVGATVVKLDGLRDKIRDAREDFDAAFSAILTPAQLARYEALKDAAKIGDEEEDD
jgi:Spy/CpxP family protein refolding chaperone